MKKDSIKLPTCYPNTVEIVSVQDVTGIRGLNNCLVEVTNINTVFFVDNEHRITTVCARPIWQNNYDYKTNPLNLRQQIVFDFANNLEIIYDGKGKYRLINLQEDIA